MTTLPLHEDQAAADESVPTLELSEGSIRLRRGNGPKLNVRRSGSGKLNCLLVHGHGDGGHVWDEVAASLASVCCVNVLDLRGHGHSDWDADGNYTLRDYVADAAYVVQHLGQNPWVIVGHSLGGEIAAHVAADGSPRVAATVLCDFGPDSDLEGMHEALRGLRDSLRVFETVSSYVAWLMTRRPLVSHERLATLAAGALGPCEGGYRLRVDPAVAHSRFFEPEPGSNEKLWGLLADLRCPVLVMRGGGSAILPNAIARKMVRTLPRGRLVTIDFAGHAVMTDNPADVTTALLAFLAEIDVPESASRGA